jgi:hypothetical protein
VARRLKRKLISAILLLALGAALVGLGLSVGDFDYSPTGSIPYPQFRSAAWLPRSEVQIGFGLLVVSVALLLSTFVEVALPSALTKERRLALLFKVLAAAVVAAGLTGFCFVCFLNETFQLQWFGRAWAINMVWALYGNNLLGVGLLGAFFLSLATCGAFVLWLGRGVAGALWHALALFAAPAAFAWTLLILVVSPRTMVVHAVNFLPWAWVPETGQVLVSQIAPLTTVNNTGIDLFSNWLVLTIAGALFISALIRRVNLKRN